MTSDAHSANGTDPVNRVRPLNKTDGLPRTNSGVQLKGLFYKATDFVINGGTYSVIAGDLHHYVGSTHNERSNNSQVTNTTDSYNHSSTRVKKEYTRSEAQAVDGGSVPRSFTGEGREIGTGKISGEGAQEIQERRRRLAAAAERRRSTTPSYPISEGDALLQSPADTSAPNGDVHRDPGFIIPSPPPEISDSSDSRSSSSESDSSDTETSEDMYRSTRTKRAKTKSSSVRGTTMLTETQVRSRKFSARTGLQSPNTESNIIVGNPFWVSQRQSPHPTVAQQQMPAVPGCPSVPHGTSPAFPRPRLYMYNCARSPPWPMPSRNLKADSNPDRKATNPFTRLCTDAATGKERRGKI